MSADSSRLWLSIKAQCSRRYAMWSAFSGGLAMLRLTSGKTSVPDSTPAEFLPAHVTTETQRAIERGLAWLAAQQQSDGGFGRSRSYARNVGVCALCGMAFLADGLRGAFLAQVERCTDYLLAHALPNGFIVEDDVVTHAPLYGHGFATMYLGQVYGEDSRPELRNALQQAVTFIIAAQDQNGAWRYTSDPEDADVSITTCQMVALYSARQAGIVVPARVIEKSVDYVQRCQNPDGGFRYRLNDPPESLFPRSAAAVVALHSMGMHDSPTVAKGHAYLATPSITPPPKHAEYFYYGRFYGAHAAWQAGDETWNRWYPTVRDELLRRQSTDGHWSDPNIGDEYATAMALIVLQFPFDSIPLFMR